MRHSARPGHRRLAALTTPSIVCHGIRGVFTHNCQDDADQQVRNKLSPTGSQAATSVVNMGHSIAPRRLTTRLDLGRISRSTDLKPLGGVFSNLPVGLAQDVAMTSRTQPVGCWCTNTVSISRFEGAGEAWVRRGRSRRRARSAQTNERLNKTDLRCRCQSHSRHLSFISFLSAPSIIEATEKACA